MDHETVGASTHLGAGPESIDVHASRTHWGAVIAAAAVVAALLAGLVVVGLAFRRRHS